MRLDGKSRRSKRGKVTIVDFWATWCAPCRASMPRVQHVFRDYTPKRASISFSIDTDIDNGSGDRDPAVREFLITNQLDFPVALDDGVPLQDAFNVASLADHGGGGQGRQGRLAAHRLVLDVNEERELRARARRRDRLEIALSIGNYFLAIGLSADDACGLSGTAANGNGVPIPRSILSRGRSRSPRFFSTTR